MEVREGVGKGVREEVGVEVREGEGGGRGCV